MKLIHLSIRSLFVKLSLIFSLAINHLLLTTNLHAASSCQLLIDQPIKLKSKLGAISLTAVNPHSILIQLKPNIFTSLDDLYGLSKDKKTWFFRITGLTPLTSGNALYLVTWATKDLPPKGTYELSTYETTHKPQFKQTFDTIGDSITWGGHGQFLRCLLRDQGLPYDFEGSHVDPFGFGHDGEGGDTTQAVLARINKIPVTDAYFLLIGTNDRTLHQDTVNNIVQIANQLYAKNNKATIYISTLLPRADAYFERNQAVNKLLLQTNSICPSCKIIDVGGAFYALKDWQRYFPDKLHPNYEGYVELAKIITRFIKNENKAKR
ncbi:SGNH/GDSL hydrolase family protein [Legionella sp. CNM-1927-20]|uniref:SGNH/GDSL hydrolase family protein n=1 Tax=Legionella sp. CNM-1927-20 TaxID=3422221 RepID=UPI00403AD41E